MERISFRKNLKEGERPIRGLYVAIPIPDGWRQEWSDIKSEMYRKYKHIGLRKIDSKKEPHITLYYWNRAGLNKLIQINEFIETNLHNLNGATVALSQALFIRCISPGAIVAKVRCSKQIEDFQYQIDSNVPYEDNFYHFSPHLTIWKYSNFLPWQPPINKTEEITDCVTRLVHQSDILSKPTPISEIYLKCRSID
jgi:2'-5' RNA ligase